MKLIRYTTQVVIKNPKLQTSTTSRVPIELNPDHIVGFIKLPNPQEGGPKAQIVTTVGPFDVFDDHDEAIKKVNE